MQLLTERDAVLQALADARTRARPLFCPNAETPDEMEAVLLAAESFARSKALRSLTVGIGITGSYPDHPQLQRLDLSSKVTLAGNRQHWSDRPIGHVAETWLNWLACYADRPGIFPRVRVIPFFDHGWASSPNDLELMRDSSFQTRMGIIMFDASQCDLPRNIAMTRAYVNDARPRVVVEACPDEIHSQRDMIRLNLRAADLITDPASAERFVKATGVDLIVPNLGTEHRGLPGARIRYRSDVARQLRRRVGSILALHGTSSLGPRVASVAHDGFCKVNFYASLARQASDQLRQSWRPFHNAPTLPVDYAAGSWVHHARRRGAMRKCLQIIRWICR